MNFCSPNHQIAIDIPRMTPESLILQPKVREVRSFEIEVIHFYLSVSFEIKVLMDIVRFLQSLSSDQM